MKFYDITQEMTSSRVFPGDAPPKLKLVQSIKNGNIINLSEINACVHNGTHVDAPFHFIDDTKTIEQLDLERFYGECSVVELEGIITDEIIIPVLENSKKRLLIKGNIEITPQAAKEVVKSELLLIGVEGLTVGPESAPMQVHLVLLGAEIAIVEGLDMKAVPAGEYILSAFPVKLGGSDGAPCRAVLISME